MPPHKTKPPAISARALEIEPFRVMDILAQARALEAQGRDIVHMEIGEPDFPTPAPIIAAGIEALKAGHTHYTPALGLPQLREAIAALRHTLWRDYFAQSCGGDTRLIRRLAVGAGGVVESGRRSIAH